MRPCALRPDRPCNGRTRLRSGTVCVTSSNVKPVIPRRLGEVGLYFLIPILYPLKHVQPLALRQSDHSLLPQ
jgi:hypothetical protein